MHGHNFYTVRDGVRTAFAKAPVSLRFASQAPEQIETMFKKQRDGIGDVVKMVMVEGE